ncbi:pali-domain-containing protein [Stereum hirsutum FP-91666 SS1]|uniref:pali-domain-containing protein n=1 Tax=Stereum hirsutum (strain FP-91666) TaxID=721885 RepID=UPI0004449F81|nr:pali-domain-containing protein [Stereum hirsutum FP-91666 SS1]EIM83060.1 pali-domain-containing protein [Stereum hirsutum FP-91666 SS1]
MPAGAAIPGLFFCFTAMVLLVFVSVSAPTWNKIYFLDANKSSQDIHFGVFGYTGTGTSFGYYFDADTLGDSRLNDEIIHNLTKTLILHPIAAGLSGLAFLFGLLGASYHRAGTVLMTLTAALAFLTTLVAWVLDMVLFGIARNRFRDNGFNSQYGNATWMTLGATASLLLAFCTAALGVCGPYRRRKTEATY